MHYILDEIQYSEHCDDYFARHTIVSYLQQMLTNPVCFLHDNVQSWQIDVIYFNSSDWAQKVGIRICVGVWRYILPKGTDCILGRQFLAGYLNCVDVHGYCNVTRSLSSLLVNFVMCLLTERQVTASKPNVPQGLPPLKFFGNYLLFLPKWQSTEKSIGQSGVSWIIPVLEISCPCRPDARVLFHESVSSVIKNKLKRVVGMIDAHPYPFLTRWRFLLNSQISRIISESNRLTDNLELCAE